MTAQDFQQDGDRRNKLAKLIANPVLKEALEILKDEIEPKAGPALPIENTTVAASLYHQHAGANSIIKGLTRLCNEFKPVKPLTGKRLQPVPKDSSQ